MVLRNKLLPYPVLTEFNDDYLNAEFSVDISYRKEKNKIEFIFDVTLTDSKIIELIEKDYATIAIHLECPQTCLRKLYKINDYSFTISLNSDHLNDEVEICSFIISTEEIKQFRSENFNPIYDDIFFDIEKYNILAYAKQVNFEIEKDYDSLKNVRSIFVIIPNHEETDVILNNYSDDFIIIKLPYKQFVTYKSFGMFPNNIPIIHSILVIPVLVEIFEKLKNDPEAWEDLADRRWFKAIKRVLEKNNFDFDKDNTSNYDSFKIAQKLINSPIITVFDNMESFMESEDEL